MTPQSCDSDGNKEWPHSLSPGYEDCITDGRHQFENAQREQAQ